MAAIDAKKQGKLVCRTQGHFHDVTVARVPTRMEILDGPKHLAKNRWSAQHDGAKKLLAAVTVDLTFRRR